MEMAYCDELGRLVSAQEMYDNYQKMKDLVFNCPECRKPVYYRDWANSKPYFAHAQFNPQCTLSKQGTWSGMGDGTGTGTSQLRSDGQLNDSVISNPQKLFEYHLRKSNEDDPKSSEWLYWHTLNTGSGPAERYKQQAILQYTILSIKGSAEASFELGEFYNRLHSYSKATEFFLRSYSQGREDAIMFAGESSYLDSKFSKRTKEYLTIASEKGYTDADFLLGEIELVKYRYCKETRDHYRKAAEGGHNTAMYRLAEILLDMDEDPEHPYSEALNWLEKASDLGEVQAQMYLANLYNEGKFVEKSPSKAFDYYLMASSHDSMAMEIVGDSYHDGTYTEKNLSKAIELYKMAANQGRTSAMFKTGMMYRNGEGIKKSNTEALKWFASGANKGDAKARMEAARLLMRGVEIPGLYKSDAIPWLERSAYMGDPEAQFLMGIFHYSGTFVHQSFKQARFWLKMASSKNEEARMFLERMDREHV